MVAASILTIARKEFISDLRRLSGSDAAKHAYPVETNKGPRILTLDDVQIALYEAIPADFSGMGLEQLVRPEDHTALREMIEKLSRQTPACTSGSELLALPRQYLDICVRWAADIGAPEALIRTVRQNYRKRPRVIVLWDWPVDPAALERFLDKLRRHNMGLWHVAIRTDEDTFDRLFRFYVQPQGAWLILEEGQD